MTATPGSSSEVADDASVRRALDALTALLIPGEQLQAYAVQHRLFALLHRRVIVGATTGRLIAVARRLLGGYDPTDIRWQDLHDTQLHVGILSASLTVSVHGSEDLASAEGSPRTLIFHGLGKPGAQEVYRACQAQAQAWREKRRVRELEELRAQSGGIQLGNAGGIPAIPGSSGEDRSPAARLQKAREMLQQRLINDAEFEQIKARILGDL
jgi:hypothetical protein